MTLTRRFWAPRNLREWKVSIGQESSVCASTKEVFKAYAGAQGMFFDRVITGEILY